MGAVPTAATRYLGRWVCLRSKKEVDWSPSVVQADFSEADFFLRGVRVCLNYFVLSFPSSNIGIAQAFGGETAECVCQGLADIFAYVGGVPALIVFDNATGVGRCVCGKVRTTELFAAYAAYYDFDFRFCNPASGNEKGNMGARWATCDASCSPPCPRRPRSRASTGGCSAWAWRSRPKDTV